MRILKSVQHLHMSRMFLNGKFNIQSWIDRASCILWQFAKYNSLDYDPSKLELFTVFIIHRLEDSFFMPALSPIWIRTNSKSRTVFMKALFRWAQLLKSSNAYVCLYVMREIYEKIHESNSFLNMHWSVADVTVSGKRFQLLTTLHAKLSGFGEAV